MIILRPAQERGAADLGWLKSFHTFSFGRYIDRSHMGFGSLRVINDDIVAPGQGFGMHEHDNMEIITYVLSGALEHKDSMGNGSIIKPGNIQYMSAGSGVAHSEFNPSATDPVHLLQIWIIPSVRDAAPAYAEKHVSDADKKGRLCLLASSDGREGSLKIRQDADMYATLLNGSDSITHHVKPGRQVWLHVARGSVQLNGQNLSAGDGAAVTDENITLSQGHDADMLLFDMAPLQ